MKRKYWVDSKKRRNEVKILKCDIALLIEEEDIAEPLQGILKKQKFKIEALSWNEDSELFLRKYSPLLLIVQGRADGVIFDVIKKFKTKKISVLIVIGPDENHADLFLKNGADEYLTWPASLLQTVTRINTILKLRLNEDDIKKVVERKTEELLEVQSVMIESLASLAEYRDTETGGHIRRTQNYVKALAKELRKLPKYEEILTDEEIDLMYLSVPLHDIGKVGVSDDILLKPGSLTPEEFEIMKQHTVIGYDAIMNAERKLKDNAFLRYAAEVAYTHQEKWDGSGYPRGISGEEIPLIGRIMSVADVYDALVSKRIYKDAIDHETAKKIIIDGSGSHFDPEIVAAFISVEETFRNIVSLYADVPDIKEKQKADCDSGKEERIRNILLIDDSKVTLSLFSNQLIHNGYNVRAVTDAEIAYEIFMNEEIDLIITDVEMPVIDGFQFVKMIRSSPHPNSGSVLIFALTASEFHISFAEAQKRGFTDYMLKPLNIELLEYKLRSFRK
jgi:putative two-component system response regulator